MISSVSSPSVAASSPAAKTAAVASTGKAAAPTGKADAAQTTHVDAGHTQVTISAAAQAAAAADKEAMETPAQTAREAQGNDQQAKRLLAKEQAAKG